jgi:hypothetical protein
MSISSVSQVALAGLTSPTVSPTASRRGLIEVPDALFAVSEGAN